MEVQKKEFVLLNDLLLGILMNARAHATMSGLCEQTHILEDCSWEAIQKFRVMIEEKQLTGLMGYLVYSLVQKCDEIKNKQPSVQEEAQKRYACEGIIALAHTIGKMPSIDPSLAENVEGIVTGDIFLKVQRDLRRGCPLAA